MSEIRKVGNSRREPIKQPKIIGAQPTGATRAPKVLDQNSKQKRVEIPTTVHGDEITIKEHTRSKPRKKTDPDVRLQLMTREDREAWKAVKTNQWEPR